MLILKLAWRNIWRNKRRSALTILAVVFTVWLCVGMRAMQVGTYRSNIEFSVNMFNGYLQVQKVGFQENQTLTKTFKYTKEIENVIKNNSDILSYTPRIYANGLIGFKDNSVGSIIFGINPEKEKNVTTLYLRVKQGTFLTSNSKYDIVLGQKMLENLKAKIGDTLVILSSGYDGSMGNLKFRICGTISMGFPEMDNMTAFINIDAAKELLNMRDRISVIAIKLKSLEFIPIVQMDLKESLNDDNLTVLGWEELMPDMKESMEFDNVQGLLYVFILLIIVAFGILNTVLMSITERFKEFGIMLALGLKHTKLLIIVFFETLFLTFIGIAIGNLIAFFTNYYITYNPIPYGGDTSKMMEEYGFLPMMFSTMDLDILVVYSFITLLTALVVFLYPAYRLYKLEALKGIRYT